MLNLDNQSKTVKYIVMITLFILGQIASAWGFLVSLSYKNLSMWETYKKALPFVWIDWIFMSSAVNISDKYDLVTPTQDTILVIIIQFIFLIIINQIYLKQDIYKSDIIAFMMVFFGFLISFFHIISKIFKIPIPVYKESGKSENITTHHRLAKEKIYREVGKI